MVMVAYNIAEQFTASLMTNTAEKGYLGILVLLVFATI